MCSSLLLVLVLAKVSETVPHTLKNRKSIFQILKLGIVDNIMAKLQIFTNLRKHFIPLL